MKPALFLVALLMLIYLIASALGSGDIGIIYFIAISASAATTGRIPWMGAYEAGVVVYIIVMAMIFYVATRSGKE